MMDLGISKLLLQIQKIKKEAMGFIRETSALSKKRKKTWLLLFLHKNRFPKEKNGLWIWLKNISQVALIKKNEQTNKQTCSRASISYWNILILFWK